jgi:hypothetical protein
VVRLKAGLAKLVISQVGGGASRDMTSNRLDAAEVHAVRAIAVAWSDVHEHAHARHA